MLLSDADILYDADGVSRFDGTDNQPTDQNEDTSQDQPPEERDDDLVSTPDQPDDDPSEAPSDSAGRTNIGDLLDITGPGGGSGGQTPSREPGKEDGGSQGGDPDRYFETSIINGDVVDYENYTFTIRHLKPLLQVRGITVLVNGQGLLGEQPHYRPAPG